MNREDFLNQLILGIKCTTGYTKELGKKYIEIAGNGGVKFDDGTVTDLSKHFPPFVAYYEYPVFKESKDKNFVAKFTDINEYDIVIKSDNFLNDTEYAYSFHTDEELWLDVNIETQKEKAKVYKFAYFNKKGVLREFPYYFENIEELEEEFSDMKDKEVIQLNYTETLIEKTFYKFAYNENIVLNA